MDQIAVKIKLQSDVSGIKQVDSALDEIKKKSKATSDALKLLEKVLNKDIGELKGSKSVDNVTVSVSKLGDKIRIASNNTDTFAQKITNIKKLKLPSIKMPQVDEAKWKKLQSDLGKQSEKLLDKIASPFKKFLRVGMYRLFRMAIQGVFNSMKEGVSIAREWSASVGNGNLDRSLDRIERSAYRIKKAFGGMVEPLINAVAPALEYLSKRIVDISNVFGEFFAKVTGQEYYLKATYDTSGLKKVEDAYDGVGSASDKASEKMKQFTLGFDELNVLAKDSPLTSGSGGGSGGSPLVEDSYSGIANYVPTKAEDLSFLKPVERAGVGIFDMFFGSDAKNTLKEAYDKSGYKDGLVWILNEVIPEGIKEAIKTDPIVSPIKDAIDKSENPLVKHWRGVLGNIFNFPRDVIRGAETGDFEGTIKSLTGRVTESFDDMWGVTFDDFYKHLRTSDIGTALIGINRKVVEKVGEDWLGLELIAKEKSRGIASTYVKELRKGSTDGTKHITDDIDMVARTWDRGMGDIEKNLTSHAKRVAGLFTNKIKDGLEAEQEAIMKGVRKPFEDVPVSEGFKTSLTKITNALKGVGSPITDTLVNNIKKGLSDKGIDVELDTTKKKISTSLNTGVKDGTSSGIKDGIKNGLSKESTSSALSGFVTDFDNKMGGLLKSPKFTNAVATAVGTVSNVAKTGINGGLSDNSIKTTAETTGKNITKALNDNIKNVALKVSGEDALTRITTATSTIKDHLSTINNTNLPNFKTAIDNIKGSVEAVEGSFSRTKGLSGDLLSNTKEMYKGILQNIGSMMGIKIPAFADGGFPDMSGELFIARESGNEFVGRMGNRSVVGNNDQIIEGVASGVEGANQGVINAIYDLLTVVREKDTIVNISATDIGKANDYYNRTKGASVSSGALTNTY